MEPRAVNLSNQVIYFDNISKITWQINEQAMGWQKANERA